MHTPLSYLGFTLCFTHVQQIWKKLTSPPTISVSYLSFQSTCKKKHAIKLHIDDVLSEQTSVDIVAH